MSKSSIDGKRLGRVPVFVCVVGVIAGTLAGATVPISIWPVPGLVLGALGGLAAGGLWYRIMIGKVARRDRRLWLWGIAWGIVAGLLATAILHGGALFVELVHQPPDPHHQPPDPHHPPPDAHHELDEFAIYRAVLIVGVALGIGAGAVAGLVCTWGCCRLVKRPHPEHCEGDT